MALTRIEEALLVAALFRGSIPSERVWSSNSDQVLTLSLFYTADISEDECKSRFATRSYVGRLYDENGQLNEEIRHRYEYLINLMQQHPDLIEGGGDLISPADPTFTACRLTDAGRQMAQMLISSFPRSPEFDQWPNRRASPDLS